MVIVAFLPFCLFHWIMLLIFQITWSKKEKIAGLRIGNLHLVMVLLFQIYRSFQGYEAFYYVVNIAKKSFLLHHCAFTQNKGGTWKNKYNKQNISSGGNQKGWEISDRKGGETQLLKMNLGIKILTTGGLKNKWETYSSAST